MDHELQNNTVKPGKWLREQWKLYLELWTELDGWKRFAFYVLNYTILFMIMWHFCFAPFAEAGRSYIWAADGSQSYFPHLVYLSKTIRTGIKKLLFNHEWTFPLYDFCLGPAKQIVSAEPLALLSMFWPWDRIDVLYDWLVVIRYYLAGLSFSLCGFYFRQKPVAILIGASTYIFCGHTYFWGVTHPAFLAPMILLPMLIVGTEKIVRKEKPWLFIVLVWITVISSVYLAVMCAAVVFLYCIIRLLDLYQGRIRKEGLAAFGKFLLSGSLGLVLSGIVLVPSLMQNVGSGRIGTGETLENLFQYESAYYQRFLNNFIVVPGDIGHITFLGFSVLAIPSIMLLFCDRGEKTRSLRICFLVLTGMLLIPAVAFAMTGFNSLQNRWSFAYVFCVALIVMTAVSKMAEVDARGYAAAALGSIVYIVVCYFLTKRQFVFADTFVLLFLALIIIFLCRKFGKKQTMAVCLILTCFSGFYSANLFYSPEKSNYISQFIQRDKAYQNLDKSQYASFAKSATENKEDDFYRVMTSELQLDNVNAAFYGDIKGLSYYTTYRYLPYIDWMNDLENAGARYLHSSYDGPDERLGICSLANVKYYVRRESGQALTPYGFMEKERVQNGEQTDIIMENQYWLPVGYTYSSYLPESEYATLDALEKQEAQLQSVVIQDDVKIERVASPKLSFENVKIPIDSIELSGAIWENGVLKVIEPNATATLKFTGLENCETYLRVNNLNYICGNAMDYWTLTAETVLGNASTFFEAEDWLYFNGMRNQILNLGFSDTPLTTCTLTFQSMGTFNLDDLEIWCMPVDHYAERIEALRAESLENVETNWRGLTGTISVSQDKLMCLAVPYDKGWTAYVDGVKTPIYQANTAWMGIELSEGDHFIEFKYWTPGRTAGIVLSCMGVLGVVALAFWERKKKQS